MKSDRVAVEDPLLLKLGLVETDTKGRVPGLQISTPGIRTLRTRTKLSAQTWLDICCWCSLLSAHSLTSSGCFFAVGFSWSPTRRSLGPRDRSEWTSTWNWTTTPPSTRRPTHLSSWVAPEVFEARIFWSSHHNYHQGISVRALVHVTASTDYRSLNWMMIRFLSQT